ADDDDDGEREGGVGDRKHERRNNRTGITLAKDGDEKQERRDREILRQQDRKTRPSGACVESSLPGKYLDDDGGGGQRKAGAENERDRSLAARKGHDRADRRRGEHDLQAAQPEDQAMHRLQSIVG